MNLQLFNKLMTCFHNHNEHFVHESFYIPTCKVYVHTALVYVVAGTSTFNEVLKINIRIDRQRIL